MRTTVYRFPGEHMILFLTLMLVLAVIALTATATVCASLIFVVAIVIFSYSASRSQHQSLMRSAQRVTPQSQPDLAEIAQVGMRSLRPSAVEIYVAPSRELNAYTFGLSSPKVIVLYSGLFQIMDADEILFILGHEMGHVALGHTWLNSLVGGMAGIPGAGLASVILSMAFLWWNRACEYSADRAGLLACGKVEKTVSALVKLAAGAQALSHTGMERALKRLDAEDDTAWGSLNEALATHPLVINRIEELRKYAATEQYRRLRSQMGA
jgi:Zn-dependent protease with chaperone function